MKICSKNNIKINGIHSKDNMPKQLHNGWYIINLDDACGGGTHWTCLYFGKYNFYFDSFGYPPPIQVQEMITPYVYNHKEIQNINSSSCGYFCICMIMYNKNGNKTDINKFLKYFTNNTMMNETILKAMLHHPSTISCGK